MNRDITYMSMDIQDGVRLRILHLKIHILLNSVFIHICTFIHIHISTIATQLCTIAITMYIYTYCYCYCYTYVLLLHLQFYHGPAILFKP